MNNVQDAPTYGQPAILVPGDDFGVETLEDGQYAIREGDVVIYGSADELRAMCRTTIDKLDTLGPAGGPVIDGESVSTRTIEHGRTLVVTGIAAQFTGDELDTLARTAGEAVYGDREELSGRQILLADRAYKAHMAHVGADDDALSYGEVKALATGNSMLLERAAADATAAKDTGERVEPTTTDLDAAAKRIAGEQGWSDEALGGLAYGFLVNAAGDGTRGEFLEFLLGAQRHENADDSWADGGVAFRWNNHNNDLGDWCPHSMAAVPADTSQEQRCSAGCRDSRAVEIPRN